MHSALKQDGKPLYEYARCGHRRERTARALVIHDMTLLDWQAPDLSFDVRCTKGTYIRVLAEDLAAHMGTIAHLAALAPARRGAVWCGTAMVVRGPGIHEPRTAAGGAAAGGCRADGLAAAGSRR